MKEISSRKFTCALQIVLSAANKHLYGLFQMLDTDFRSCILAITSVKKRVYLEICLILENSPMVSKLHSALALFFESRGDSASLNYIL